MAAGASRGGPEAAPPSPLQGLGATVRAWRTALMVLVLVLALHLLFLRGVANLLPTLGGPSAPDEIDQVFSTRSIASTHQSGAQSTVVAPVRPPPGPTVRPPGPATPAGQAPEASALPTAAEPQPTAAPVANALFAPPAAPAAVASAPLSAVSAARADTTQAAPAAAAASAASADAPFAAAASPMPTAASPAQTSPGDAPAGGAKGLPAPSYHYAFPPPVRLKYDVAGLYKGFQYRVAGDLSWLHDGSDYTARLEISHFLLGSKVQTSKGAITPQGLEPLRFGEKVRSEVAAHFEREKGKVSFSANTPDVPLLPLAQDQVSIFVQLAAMFAADGKAFAPGSKLVFQTLGARGAEDWEFVVAPPERLVVQGKEWLAYKLVREHRAEYDTRAELWLAPALDGMPLRIRLTQTSGDEIDMTWTRSQKP